MIWFTVFSVSPIDPTSAGNILRRSGFGWLPGAFLSLSNGFMKRGTWSCYESAMKLSHFLQIRMDRSNLDDELYLTGTRERELHTM